MAYDWHTPPDPTYLQDWYYRNMFACALRKRAFAAGQQFPPGTISWFNGVASGEDWTWAKTTAISATALTWDVGDLDPDIVSIIGGGGAGVNLPRSWAFIVWCDAYEEPHMVLRGRITAVSGRTATIHWENNWRLRHGPNPWARYLDKRISLVANGPQWPHSLERLPPRPSDIPQCSGTVHNASPYAIWRWYYHYPELGGDPDGVGFKVVYPGWPEAAVPELAVGDQMLWNGGPLDGQTLAVSAVAAESPTPPYNAMLDVGFTGVDPADFAGYTPTPLGSEPEDWTIEHAEPVIHFTKRWGDDALPAGDWDLVVGDNRWRILEYDPATGRLKLQLESGDTLPEWDGTQYAAIIPADGYWSDEDTSGETTAVDVKTYHRVLDLEMYSRGPFYVENITPAPGPNYWFTLQGHTFKTGDTVLISGGPLNLTSHTITAVSGQQVQISDPGTWEAPYVYGWTMRHAATIWPMAITWPTTPEGEVISVDPAGMWLIVGGSRWLIVGLNAAEDRLELALHEGETELPLERSGYAIVGIEGSVTEIDNPPDFAAALGGGTPSRTAAFPWYTGLHKDTVAVIGAGTYRGVMSNRFAPMQTLNLLPADNNTVFDRDVTIPYAADQAEPVRFLARDFYHSVRSWQQFLYDLSYYFTPVAEYDQTRWIPHYVVRLFVDAIGSGSLETLTLDWASNWDPYNETYTPYDLAAECNTPAWYEPWMGDLYYCIVCTSRNKRAVKWNLVTPGNDGKCHFTFDALGWFEQDFGTKTKKIYRSHAGTMTLVPDEQYSVYLSPGWRRQVPAAFRYLYAKTCVMPSAESASIQDHKDRCGYFFARPASATYEDGSAFEEGHMARYLGDGKHYPPTTLATFADPSRYRDAANFYTGKVPSWSSPHVLAGPITAAGPWHILCGGLGGLVEGRRLIASAHQATAASGTSTSFTAAGKLAVYDSEGELLSGSAMWSEPDNDPDGPKPRFIGMTAIIHHSGADYPVLITGHNLATQTVSWAHALPVAVAAGDTIDLYEPQVELNRFAGRQVVLELPECTVGPATFPAATITATVLGHGENALFPDLAEALPLTLTVEGVTYTRDVTGATWTITEYLPGEVWQRSGGEWVRPVSTLPLQNLAPTLLSRTGLKGSELWDYVGRVGDNSVWEQMWRMLNLLRWTWQTGSFSRYSDGAHTTQALLAAVPKTTGYQAPEASSGNPRASVDTLLDRQPYLIDDPYPVPLYTGDGAGLVNKVIVTCDTNSNPKFVIQTWRSLIHNWYGGHAHASLLGNVRELACNVDFYLHTKQLDPFYHSSADAYSDPNDSKYLSWLDAGVTTYYVAPEDHVGRIANSLIGKLHVHPSGTIAPPEDHWPELDTSHVANFDPMFDPIPPGWPGLAIQGQVSWGADVYVIARWNMAPYDPPPAP